MADILTKDHLHQIIQMIQQIYLSDNIPWICGYSGGKDSSAAVQLVWMALQQLPIEKRRKVVHIISTDTLVESPVVAAWAERSLSKIREAAEKEMLPFVPHRLTPQIQNTYWVNLIGRGYPYPRPNFRWCTGRMKIDPSNQFIKSVLEAESEAILVLGTRKAESKARKAVMESYEKKRYRQHLSPNGSFPNTYVLTPIENWTDSMVWQFLMQYPNPWGHSNKDLLAMYRGASVDNECPLVFESGTPTCGGSRMGCWVCTMVAQDKSRAAMIHNDEEKAWMLPLLEFRNFIAAYNQDENRNALDRRRRDFRRMTGNLTLHNGRLVHGPYKKEVREELLCKLLRLQTSIRKTGPEELKGVNLITHEELCFIRRLWLNEKHEFDDALPRIYKEATGEDFEDKIIKGNKYYGQDEWDLLKEICQSERFRDYELLLELQSTLLDMEAKSSAVNAKKNVIKNLESEIKRAYYKDEQDAEHLMLDRRRRGSEEEPIPDMEEQLPEDAE